MRKETAEDERGRLSKKGKKTNIADEGKEEKKSTTKK